MEEDKKFNYKILMMTTLIISGCSIIYEVLISSVSSYLVGDSIKQFSITIGLYMCAMGVGSYLSKFIRKHLFDWFVLVELGVGIFGGISSLILFLSNVYIESYELVMYIQIILIGTLVGLEIPLLTRIIEDNAKNLRVTLSSIFSFDYIGGLIGSIAFPLILLPKFGYFATAFLTGTLNIIISIIIILKYKNYIKNINLFKISAVLALLLMLLGTIFSENIANNIESKSKILILGGGDGLAVREVLKYEDVENITLVDLDEDMVELCRNNKNIVDINKGALTSSKLNVVYNDAFKYLQDSNDLFDVILIDLPDPNDENLNKLYTNVFYRLVGSHLNEGGIISVQSTSPYYAKKAFWCINKTLEEEEFYVLPYHVQVPSFGEWGFQLASRNPIDIENIHVDVETKFLNNETVDKLFSFSEDEKVDKDKLLSNTLSRPQLIEYYLEAVNNWR